MNQATEIQLFYAIEDPYKDEPEPQLPHVWGKSKRIESRNVSVCLKCGCKRESYSYKGRWFTDYYLFHVKHELAPSCFED